MASSCFSFFLLFLVVSSLALEVACARDVPAEDAKFAFDGTVWVPGLGRYMLPKKGSKSLDYNPITGAPGGNGFSIPGLGSSTGGGGGSYIPGGDDTFVPNPGMEVPVPDGGGAVPTPSSP